MIKTVKLLVGNNMIKPMRDIMENVCSTLCRVFYPTHSNIIYSQSDENYFFMKTELG